MTCFRFRRAILGAGLAIGLLAAPASAQQPEAYPSRPVKIVVGFAPGGSNDIIARLIAERFNAAFGQPFIVENKPGAGALLATSQVAKEPADGYTLLVGASGAMTIAPAVFTKMPYDTLQDFEPISILGTFPLLLLVSGESEFKTVKDFVAWTKANAEKSNYASASPLFTLAAELFKLKTGAQMQRVGYRGSNDAVLAVVAQQTSAAVVDPLPAIPLVRDGKARALGAMAKARIPELPDVPTLAEQGVDGLDFTLWTGLFAPKGTPPEIVNKLSAEVAKIMKDPEVKKRLRTLATDAASSAPAEFAARIKSDIQSWTEVAKAANFKIER